MEGALLVASRCEQARLAIKASVPSAPHSPASSMVAALDVPTSKGVIHDMDMTGRLTRAIESLTSRMDELQFDVGDLKSRDRMKERRRGYSPHVCSCTCGGCDCGSSKEEFARSDGVRGRSPWRRPLDGDSWRQPARRRSYVDYEADPPPRGVDMGGPHADGYERGRSPQRWSPRDYTARGASSPQWRPRSSRVERSPRRLEDEDRRSGQTPEERRAGRGVRFLSPSRRSPSPSSQAPGNGR